MTSSKWVGTFPVLFLMQQSLKLFFVVAKSTGMHAQGKGWHSRAGGLDFEQVLSRPKTQRSNLKDSAVFSSTISAGLFMLTTQ